MEVKNMEFKELFEILKNGTKAEKEQVWKYLREEKANDPNASKFKDNPCQTCKEIHKLYSWAWKISKKESWNVNHYCEACDTA
jgi:hypothetical protein